MYCLRLFVLQELHCLLQHLHKLLWCVLCVYTKFHLDRLLCEWDKGHLCPYRNEWTEAVYCCLQELHCLLNCLDTCLIRVRGCYHVAKFRCTTLSSY